jgi:putative restriction endonuclease
MAAWPAFIVADDPANLVVTVAIDDETHAALGEQPQDVGFDQVVVARRAYVTSLVRSRLHQRSFRERVLEAYRRQCAFCRLRHEELLEAAHIVEDSHPRGVPAVQNGLSLCALHHTAFDRLFIGLRPDYVIEVRGDILREADGPTLAHAIQGLHGRPIILPRVASQRPDPELLELKYDRFRQAS